MKKKMEAIGALERLVRSWPNVDGPEDFRYQEWIAAVMAHLVELDTAAASRIHHLARYMMLPLSTYTLGPVWSDILSTIRAAVTRGKVELRDREDKVYPAGAAADLERDLARILGAATESIFVVEPYADETIFGKYLDRTDPRVTIRLLTKNVSPATVAAAAAFSATHRNFSARKNAKIHDRVILVDEADCWVLGQSIKDAATRKPTYLIPVAAILDMAKLYEDMWNDGQPP